MTGVVALDILTGPFALALIGYAILLIALLYWVDPAREKMVRLAEDLLAEAHWNKEQREEINLLLDASMSFRVGFLVWLGIVSFIVDELLGREAPCTDSQRQLGQDPRFERLVRLFALSIGTANPLAALVSLPLMVVAGIVSMIADRMRQISHPHDLIEGPMLRALNSVSVTHRPAS